MEAAIRAPVADSSGDMVKTSFTNFLRNFRVDNNDLTPMQR